MVSLTEDSGTEIQPSVDRPATSGRPPWLRPRSIRPVWFGIMALGLITLYFTVSENTYLFTFNLCLLAVFGAVALNLLMGTAGMVSIGNSAFMAVGAFATVYFQRSGIPFPVDIVLAAVVAGGAGVIIGLPALRLSGLHLFLATLAGFFIVIYFTNEYQAHAKGAGTGGFYFSPLFSSKGLNGGQVWWAWMLFGLVALLILGMSRLAQERSGRAWRVMRDHEIVAHTLGIPVMRYKLIAFALSSMVIGFQGGLIAHFSGSVTSENFTFQLAITYAVMVLVGGLDSIAGAVVGAGIVTALPIVVPKVVSGLIGAEQAAAKGPAFSTILYGALVIIFITCSPNGIVGLVRKIVARRRTRSAGRGAPDLIA